MFKLSLKLILLSLLFLAVASQQEATATSQTNNLSPSVSIDELDIFSNLTPQQKQKLLHEESIRAQLHSNQSLSLAELAKLTPQQQKLFAQKLAQQSKIAYQRAHKQIKEREDKEEAEMKKLLSEVNLSLSEQTKFSEQLKLKNLYSQNNYTHLLAGAEDFMFQIDPNAEEDFMLSLPVEQNIALLIAIYSNQDGVYLKASNIERVNPLNLKIFHNHHRIIYEQKFYFTDSYIFKGEKDVTYTFRFTNSQNHRLVSLKISQVLEKAEVQSKATITDIASHSYRSKALKDVFFNRFTNLDSTLTLQTSNRKLLSSQIRRYYLFTIGQMVFFIILVFLQIEMIRKLLDSSSIV